MKFKIISTFLFLTILSANIFSQSISIGAGAGYVTIANDEFTKSLAENGLGFSGSFRYGVVVKIGAPVAPLKAKAYLYFNDWESTGLTNTILGYNITKVNAKGTLYTFGAGVELNLIPGPIRPFVAADLLISSFNQKLKFDSDFIPDTEDKNTRIGAALGGGLSISIASQLVIDASIKYSKINLGGKEDKEKDLNTINAMVEVLFPIF